MELQAVPLWAIIGAIAGCFLSLEVRSRRPQASVEDLIVGVLGGILGGTILTAINPSDPISHVPSVLAAVILSSLLIAALHIGYGEF